MIFNMKSSVLFIEKLLLAPVYTIAAVWYQLLSDVVQLTSISVSAYAQEHLAALLHHWSKIPDKYPMYNHFTIKISVSGKYTTM